MKNALENLLHVGVKKLKKPVIIEAITNKYSLYQTEEKKLLFVKENSKLEV